MKTVRMISVFVNNWVSNDPVGPCFLLFFNAGLCEDYRDTICPNTYRKTHTDKMTYIHPHTPVGVRYMVCDIGNPMMLAAPLKHTQ